MDSSLYVRKIINEIVGQELSRVDTTTPGYISFFNRHTDGLSPDEVEDFGKLFQNQMQFISEFKWCFLAIYLDYCNGNINLPVGDVVRDIIGELIKVHYPAECTMILNNKVCQGFITGYAYKFKWMLMFPKKFDSDTFKKTGKSPVDKFAYINAHQLVNVISLELGDLEKKNQPIPLQLYKEEEGRESVDENTGEEEYIPDYLVQLNSAAINRQKCIKSKWGYSIVILMGILLMSYLTTASLNPLTIFQANNILTKVIVTVLMGLIAVLFLQLLMIGIKRLFKPNFDPSFDIFGLRGSVEAGTGKKAGSAICPSCGLLVLRNNDILGLPIVCHTCRVAWHDGPKCYRKEMPPSNDILPSYPCPNCRSSGTR